MRGDAARAVELATARMGLRLSEFLGSFRGHGRGVCKPLAAEPGGDGDEAA